MIVLLLMAIGMAVCSFSTIGLTRGIIKEWLGEQDPELKRFVFLIIPLVVFITVSTCSLFVLFFLGFIGSLF